MLLLLMKLFAFYFLEKGKVSILFALVLSCEISPYLALWIIFLFPYKKYFMELFY